MGAILGPPASSSRDHIRRVPSSKTTPTPRCSSLGPNSYGTRGCDAHSLVIRFPQKFFRFIQVAYALPEWWVVTVYSGSIFLFCFKGESPYLFATCSVQSTLKFRLPSLRLLADCLPTDFCQRLDTIYIYIYIYQQLYICEQLPPFSFLLFMHFLLLF